MYGDIKREFDADSRGRNLSAAARHRKNGSKSKQCSLPSDGLTHKQWKERCGEVMVFCLSKPMTWAEFKGMPKDLREEYITGLQKRYNASSVPIASMFGISVNAFREHVKNHGLNIQFSGRGHTMNAAEKEVWSRFLNNEIEELKPEIEECQPVIEAQNGDSTPDSVADEPKNDVKTPDVMVMNQVNLQFSGRIDVESIANSLRYIIGPNAVGEVEVTFRIHNA